MDYIYLIIIADSSAKNAARWWRFPNARIGEDSEIEWRGDGIVSLLDADGNLIEGVELTDAEVEQFSRESAG